MKFCQLIYLFSLVEIKILSINHFMKRVSTSGLWITWMSWRTLNVYPTTSPWLRSQKMFAVKMDQFRLGLWEYKSKVCFYTQEICDICCVKIMKKQREITDHRCFCEKSKVQRRRSWIKMELCGDNSQTGIATDWLGVSIAKNVWFATISK